MFVKKSLTAIIFALTHFISFGQWETLSSGTSNELRSVWFINQDTGVVVGEAGTILRTDNGGANWTKITSGTDVLLYSVEFTSTQIGYVAGKEGVILRTTDSGITWNDISIGNETFFSSSFISNDTGYVSGTNGALYKTLDGGNNWTDLKFDSGVLHAAHFFSVDTGFVIRWKPTIRTILKTTDGGVGWDSLNYNISETFTSLYFTDRLAGYTTTTGPGGGYVWKTTNGGESWFTTYHIDYGGFYSIYSPSAQVVYAVGGFGTSTIHRSIDGGAHWTGLIDATNGTLYDCYFLDEENGYAVGMGGKILKRTGTPVAIMSLMDLNAIKVYPNPVTDVLCLEIPASIKFPPVLSITDLSGRKIISAIKLESEYLDLTMLLPGAYILSIESSGRINSKLIIKE